MKRPDMRPMNKLPMLEAHRDTFEKCVFCPKLCRSACPVSNAEPRETITPWGKMSLPYFAAHGDVPLDTDHAAPAWACTGCMACRESCDHRNEVAPALYEARAALSASGVAPAAATRIVGQFAAHDEETTQATRELLAHSNARADAKQKLLIGCSYVRALRGESEAAIRVASKLTDSSVSLTEGCCGLPLLLAGSGKGFVSHATRFAEQLGDSSVVVVDPGCAMALRVHYPRLGILVRARVETLVERAARHLQAFRPLEGGENVRYHDPCQLGRGLGLYEEPRAILNRILGRPPLEFPSCRERATCSGAGGLLPTTMPETSREITKGRIAEHRESGGGRVVTACASSLISMRKQAGTEVDDLVTWMARALS